MNASNKSRLVPYSLSALQTFIGLTAIAGGFRLVSNPNGTKEFPIECLYHSLFTDYFIPGIVLLAVIGFGNVFAAMVTFLRKHPLEKESQDNA